MHELSLAAALDQLWDGGNLGRTETVDRSLQSNSNRKTKRVNLCRIARTTAARFTTVTVYSSRFNEGLDIFRAIKIFRPTRTKRSS